MKKKLFLSILALFVFSVCLIRVNAATTALFSVGWQIEAASPKLDESTGKIILPAESKTYGTVSNYFDFSKVVFADSGGSDLPGKQSLRKIIIGEPNVTNNQSAVRLAGETDEGYVKRLLGKYYFTAYCLNEGLKYPMYGLFNLEGVNGYSQAVEPDGSFNDTNTNGLYASIALASIMNDDRTDSPYKAVITTLLDSFNDPARIEVDPDSIELGPDDAMDSYLAYLSGTSTTPVQIGIRQIAFYSSDMTDNTNVYFVSRFSDPGSTAAEEAEAKTAFEQSHSGAIVKYITGSAYTTDYVPLKTAGLADLAFQKYKRSNASATYNHALWIVENSYPTLDIDTVLNKAEYKDGSGNIVKINVTNFKNKVRTLYNLTDPSTITDETAKAEAQKNWDNHVEMVVYGIVQYAVWKVTDHQVDGKTIGNQIINDADFNTLFTYLINSENVPSNYHQQLPYSKTLSVSKPEKNKELAKSKDGIAYYGPYSISYTGLVEDNNKITYTIQNNTKNAIKVVDANFREVTELDKGQQFYISVVEKEEIKTVNIDFKLNNIIIFKPDVNRGQILSPISALSQDVLVGGRTKKDSISGALEIKIGNPNTGIQNIALLLMVTLIAFTLGYLVLSYKQKPIRLQQ